MSILFEAWRRTRGERSQWARTLGATSPAPQKPSRPALLPWLLCGLLVALLAGVGVYAWLIHAQAGRQASPSTLAASRVSPPVSERADHRPLPAERQADIADTRTAANGPPPVKTMAKPKAAAPALAPRDAEASSPGQDRARLGADKKDSESTHPSAKTRSKPAGPVALSALPADVRQAFPDFTIVAHVWNTDKAMRFVVSNGRRIEVGEDIAAGVRLLEVRRHGEIVRFRGYRIRLP